MRADKEKVTRLLKTAKGQLEGILRMVEQDQYCLDISHQLMSCQAILQKVNREIIQGHMEACVQDAFESGSSEERSKKVTELVDLINRL